MTGADRTSGNRGSSAEGVVTREGQDAVTRLRQRGRGAGDGAGDRDIARAGEGEGPGTGGDRRGVAEGERAGVRLNRRCAIQGHRAAKGIGTGKIAQGAVGRRTGAGDPEGFGTDGDVVLEFKRGARGDAGTAGDGA